MNLLAKANLRQETARGAVAGPDRKRCGDKKKKGKEKRKTRRVRRNVGNSVFKVGGNDGREKTAEAALKPSRTYTHIRAPPATP